MANVLAFDTLAYARRLKEAGVDDAQAEAHAEAVRDAVTEGVATKAELETSIAGLRTDLKASVMHLEGKIENIEGKIENIEGKIENCATKADVYRLLWIQTGTIAGMIVAASGVVVALIKLLP